MVFGCSVRVGHLSLVREGFITEKLLFVFIFTTCLRQSVFPWHTRCFGWRAKSSNTESRFSPEWSNGDYFLKKSLQEGSFSIVSLKVVNLFSI